MPEDELTEMASQMRVAYIGTKTRGEAVEFVKSKNCEADLTILEAIWEGIDAYVDAYDGFFLK